MRSVESSKQRFGSGRQLVTQNSSQLLASRTCGFLGVIKGSTNSWMARVSTPSFASLWPQLYRGRALDLNRAVHPVAESGPGRPPPDVANGATPAPSRTN